MNKRQKAKRKGEWMYIRKKYDSAIRAICRNCWYSYSCFELLEKSLFSVVPAVPHKYCPNCGLKMHLYDEKMVYMIDEEGIIIKYRDYNNGLEDKWHDFN